jgi:Ankyrin repeats (many copies)/Ankyrin repeats (3 copies)
VCCQLDALCRCLRPSIHHVLDELPDPLYETYERALQVIHEQKRQYAQRLFQCLVAAIRPLRVEELAEIFIIEFDSVAAYNLIEDWRPENAEAALLSTCSTLISIVSYEHGKIAQFSHFSVKDFLTSDRLRRAFFEDISYYHISFDAAHTVLAQACLTVLLQLDEKMDKKRLATLPLAFYAAQHWVDHAKFGNVVPRIQDAMERFFDPKKAHFEAWTWLHDLEWWGIQTMDDLPERPSPPDATPLYYAAFCGFTGLARYLIITHEEDVNAKCGGRGSPLHAASCNGHVDVARLLLDHGADANSSSGGVFPLRRAYDGGHPEVMRLLLDHGAGMDVQDGNAFGTLLHDASWDGQVEVVKLLLQRNVNVNATGFENQTPLHMASLNGHTKVAKLLLQRRRKKRGHNRRTITPAG